MSESSPIKDALYAKIDGIGQEQIHQLLLNNKFSELFERIYEPVIHSVCLLYTSPSPRDKRQSRMPSSA